MIRTVYVLAFLSSLTLIACNTTKKVIDTPSTIEQKAGDAPEHPDQFGAPGPGGKTKKAPSSQYATLGLSKKQEAGLNMINLKYNSLMKDVMDQGISKDLLALKMEEIKTDKLAEVKKLLSKKQFAAYTEMLTTRNSKLDKRW